MKSGLKLKHQGDIFYFCRQSNDVPNSKYQTVSDIRTAGLLQKPDV